MFQNYTRGGAIVVFLTLYIVALIFTVISLPDVFFDNEYRCIVEALGNDMKVEELPEGYWIDEERSTQRIYCLRSPNGDWGRWSWSSNWNSEPVSFGHGWQHYVKLFAIPFGVAVVLFIVITPIFDKFY